MAAASALCEFLDVVTHAVAKLNIYWLAVKQDAHPKSKLEQFLPSKVQPPCWDLPFLPDHHTEVSRSWRKPFSVSVFSPHVSNYSSIMGLKEHGYGVMPKVEQALVRPCNLSPAWHCASSPRHYPPGHAEQLRPWWGRCKLLSLRAGYIPGHLNMGTDILLRQGLRPGNWRLPPQVVGLFDPLYCLQYGKKFNSKLLNRRSDDILLSHLVTGHSNSKSCC
ncbi:hypothetical protein DPX16_16472 [Anabarilius grahami]|uniref:Uncharacterized protein n=1 Tax=Anabarilius grahami TaxID=495550 RepID=A0A3N0XZJ0_ANAGA|nr:hypothetical protein DPX16_16472 [Anabarilius grahami]